MENDIETGLINNKKDSNTLRYYIHFYLGFCIFILIVLFITMVILILVRLNIQW